MIVVLRFLFAKKDLTVLIILLFFSSFSACPVLVEAERSRGIKKYDLSSYFYATINK